MSEAAAERSISPERGGGNSTGSSDGNPPIHVYLRHQTKAPFRKNFGMKNRTPRIIIITQLAVITLFLFLTLGNEIIDVPHYLFNDAPTSYSQRVGEIVIVLSIFFVVMTIQIRLFRKLYRRIRILEGFIPICASCKKVRNAKDQWEEMERYITKHSLAQFSHSICPSCARELYPDLFVDNMGRTK
jgi:hypothetical protein